MNKYSDKLERWNWTTDWTISWYRKMFLLYLKNGYSGFYFSYFSSATELWEESMTKLKKINSSSNFEWALSRQNNRICICMPLHTEEHTIEVSALTSGKWAFGSILKNKRYYFGNKIVDLNRDGCFSLSLSLEPSINRISAISALALIDGGARLGIHKQK